jgi:hypothetical protein
LFKSNSTILIEEANLASRHGPSIKKTSFMQGMYYILER